MENVAYVLTLILISSSCSPVDTLPSFSPSLCCSGFVVNDARRPYLLGKGFGPMPYKHLCDLWTTVNQEIASIDCIDKEHIDEIKSLMSGMADCDETKQHE